MIVRDDDSHCSLSVFSCLRALIHWRCHGVHKLPYWYSVSIICGSSTGANQDPLTNSGKMSLRTYLRLPYLERRLCGVWTRKIPRVLLSQDHKNNITWRRRPTWTEPTTRVTVPATTLLLRAAARRAWRRRKPWPEPDARRWFWSRTTKSARPYALAAAVLLMNWKRWRSRPLFITPYRAYVFCQPTMQRFTTTRGRGCA